MLSKIKAKVSGWGITIALEAQYTVGPLIRSKQVNFGTTLSGKGVKYKSSCVGVYTNIGFSASINVIIKFTRSIPTFPDSETEYDQVAFGITGVVPTFASLSVGGAILGGKKSSDGLTSTKVSGIAVIIGMGAGVGTEHVIPVNFSVKVCKARSFTWPWK